MEAEQLAQDRCVSTMPWFEIHPEKLESFKQYCREYINRTANEPACLYYGFSFQGNLAHCRECYVDAEGVLAHMRNLQELNIKTLNLARITRFEIHGPTEELDKLRAPLAFLKPSFYQLEMEYRRPVVMTGTGNIYGFKS